MLEKAWIDLSIIRCPNCGRIYVDASWYVIEMESDIECRECGETFNTKRNAIDRVMLEFKILNGKRAIDVEIIDHLSLKS